MPPLVSADMCIHFKDLQRQFPCFPTAFKRPLSLPPTHINFKLVQPATILKEKLHQQMTHFSRSPLPCFSFLIVKYSKEVNFNLLFIILFVDKHCMIANCMSQFGQTEVPRYLVKHQCQVKHICYCESIFQGRYYLNHQSKADYTP